MKLKNNDDVNYYVDKYVRELYITGIILTIFVAIIGIVTVVLNFTVEGNADRYVPVKVVGECEEL